MKATTLITGLLAAVCVMMPAAARAQTAGSAFTYQGQLTEFNVPANGAYDFQFTLYDDRDTLISGPIDVEDLLVYNGLFSVILDFGPGALSGDIRMLEIAVRPGASVERHELLSPRQELTPAPYASTALRTVGVDGHSLDAEDGFPTDVVFTDRVGNVGVGTRSPSHQLHVIGITGPAVVGENASGSTVGQLGSENGGVYGQEAGPGGTGVYGQTDSGTGVYGQADSGIGVYGEALAGTGVEGYTLDPNGTGIQGHNEAESGNAIAVWGQTGSPDGYGGYFHGRGFFSGNVGIGTTPTDSPLTVAGLIESSTGGFKFPDGTMQTTAATGGGGDSYWIPSSSGIFYDEGYVGVGVEYPLYSLHAIDPVTTAIGGECVGEGTTGYLGHESAAVYGELCRGSLAYGGWFGGKGYFADAVGIGTTPEGAMLVVEGLIDCTADGVRFPDGTIQTTAAAGGGGLWQQSGSDIYYDTGDVGIGTDVPSHPLHVIADSGTAVWGESPAESTVGYLAGEYAGVYGEAIWGAAVLGYTLSENAAAVHGHNESGTGLAIGILGESGSPDGYAGYFAGRGYFSSDVGIGTTDPASMLHVVDSSGTAITGTYELEGNTGYLGHVNAGVYGEVASGHGVYGVVTGTGGFGVHGQAVDGTGVYGEVSSPDGEAVYGYNDGPTGNAIAVKGESPEGFAGYFLGRGFFSGDVGIGVPVPSEALDVAGTVKASGLQLTTSPTEGHVLTCDASGVAAWQAPADAELTLPYDGTVDSTGPALKVTNTGTGLASHGIFARINNSDSETNVAAGLFNANDSNGWGIYVLSDANETIYAYHDGPEVAVRGISTGEGGAHFNCDGSGGYGVKGRAFDGTGVHAESAGTGTTQPALYAENTSGSGIAIFARNDSLDANAVFVNQGTGDIIKGFSGLTGGNLVFKVTNDGTTHTNVLQVNGGSDLSEQFDVRSQGDPIEPGLVVCIDAANPGKLIVSSTAYDRTVAGIISGAGGIAPGMQMGQKGSLADGEHPIALTGRVYVRADASNGAIRPGDLLTTADVPGHAMKVTDYARAQGAILGKAMTGLDEGRGLVLVLVSLQ